MRGLRKQLPPLANPEVAREVMDIPAEPEWSSMPNRQWDAKVWVSNSAKIHTQLGWQPKHTFAEGFRQMLKWFEQGPLRGYTNDVAR